MVTDVIAVDNEQDEIPCSGEHNHKSTCEHVVYKLNAVCRETNSIFYTTRQAKKWDTIY